MLKDGKNIIMKKYNHDIDEEGKACNKSTVKINKVPLSCNDD